MDEIIADYEVDYPDIYILECSCKHISIREEVDMIDANWLHDCPACDKISKVVVSK